MKFRISQSPKDNEEGKVISLIDAALLLGLSEQDLFEQSYFAVSVSKDNYILEVIREEENNVVNH
jgi:hypothetical protein